MKTISDKVIERKEKKYWKNLIRRATNDYIDTLDEEIRKRLCEYHVIYKRKFKVDYPK